MLCSALALLPASVTKAEEPSGSAIAPRPLVDLSAAGSEARFSVDGGNKAQVTVTKGPDNHSVVVNITPGPAGFPGVSLKPESGSWDLSPFGHIQAKVTNLGTEKMSIGLRVDDSRGWENNDSEVFYLKPGESITGKVIFGYSYGRPGKAIKSSSIAQLLIFAGKATKEPEIFRIEAVEAAGAAGEKPPVDPNTIRIEPKDGILLGKGAAPLDPAKCLAEHGAHASLVDASGNQRLKVVFPAGNDAHSAGIKPAVGRWRLTSGLEVKARVRNEGTTPITPTLRVESNGGPIQSTPGAPLAPGAEAELVASFISPKVWQNLPPDAKHAPGTGAEFTSNHVSAVLVSAAPGSGEGILTVESIKADRPAYSAPAWLGQRPPVEGDWTKTFDEEFNESALDPAKWNISASPNYWDQSSHFSKANVVLGGGTVKLHYEKKTGHQADDPKQKETDYAVGYLDTLGKWTQRYGYWEARVKVPTAPGLWTAFWLMPDRGEAQKWKRSDTGNGAMEFDIMEFISGWGPCRYNIAMHWDGYGANHKSIGSDRIYVQPDPEGFVTAGMLWTPGSAVYYCNGKEIFHYESPRVSNVPSYIMLDMVSGGWDNEPLDDAKLPADFTIDYIRVWQRKDLAAEPDASAAQTPPATK